MKSALSLEQENRWAGDLLAVRAMSFMFKNLKVYQKSVDLAEIVSRLTESFPRGTYYLTDQLNRAALSISLNIAEGNGRWHKPDRKNFFYIARGSCHECVPLLEICFRKKLIDKDRYDFLNKELEEIAKMISGLIGGG